MQTAFVLYLFIDVILLNGFWSLCLILVDGYFAKKKKMSKAWSDLKKVHQHSVGEQKHKKIIAGMMGAEWGP